MTVADFLGDQVVDVGVGAHDADRITVDQDLNRKSLTEVICIDDISREAPFVGTVEGGAQIRFCRRRQWRSSTAGVGDFGSHLNKAPITSSSDKRGSSDKSCFETLRPPHQANEAVGRRNDDACNKVGWPKIGSVTLMNR